MISAIFTDYEKILKRKISEYSKLKNEEKKYITEMFNRIRRNMMPVKMNQVSDKNHAKNLWKCAECGNIDSQTHILWYPFFLTLREGKSLENDTELVEYFKEVFKTREERKTN